MRCLFFCEEIKRLRFCHPESSASSRLPPRLGDSTRAETKWRTCTSVFELGESYFIVYSDSYATCTALMQPHSRYSAHARNIVRGERWFHYNYSFLWHVAVRWNNDIFTWFRAMREEKKGKMKIMCAIITTASTRLDRIAFGSSAISTRCLIHKSRLFRLRLCTYLRIRWFRCIK